MIPLHGLEHPLYVTTTVPLLFAMKLVPFTRVTCGNIDVRLAKMSCDSPVADSTLTEVLTHARLVHRCERISYRERVVKIEWCRMRNRLVSGERLSEWTPKIVQTPRPRQRELL